MRVDIGAFQLEADCRCEILDGALGLTGRDEVFAAQCIVLPVPGLNAEGFFDVRQSLVALFVIEIDSGAGAERLRIEWIGRKSVPISREGFVPFAGLFGLLRPLQRSLGSLLVGLIVRTD